MKKLVYMILLIVLTPIALKADELKDLKTHVYYFASDDLEGRDTGSQGMFAAAQYVVKECKEYNINVSMVPVGNCRNVIAWIKGKDPNKIIVIGAHLDHIGIKHGRIYNGADDNASGSAAVLALAKRFSETKPNYTLTFQWYTGEECGFLGSKHYVNEPRLPEKYPDIKKHIFMLNLDMVGRLNQKGICRREPIDIPIILKGLYEKYPFAERITYRNDKNSDQAVFAPYMPVVFLHTGTHSDYHKPTDDADRIDYEGMVQVCNYAYDLVSTIIGEPEIEDYILYGLPIYEGKP